ncbi:MAG: hypothetical protein V4621_07120 [Pseudomonadota bacterium]
MSQANTTILTYSQLYVWRSLVALAHVDGKLTNNEWQFLLPSILRLNLLDEQRDLLQHDLKNPQKVADMFQNITKVKDRAQFFVLAGQLVYADGDYDEAEKKILLELSRSPLKDAPDYTKIAEDVRILLAEDDSTDELELDIRGDTISFSQKAKRP